jgi:serine protease Do
MSKRQYILGLFLASMLGGFIVLAGISYFYQPERSYESFEQKQNVLFSSYLSDSAFTVPEGLNFIYAAETAKPAVVYIRTYYESSTAYHGSGDEEISDMFREYHPFGGRFGSPRPRESAGSGVVISSDGYIATNNHVVENASKIEVIMDDKRSFSGTVIGTDPTTDLALIKIDGRNLPFVKYGNSDKLRLGEWVLALGNPFDLTSTVTAGIVSAKGRNINILQDKERMQVESFIQTDAAVNPGNSGGALVNLRGELVGINTAIATSTRFSQGYSFAVPVTLVRKVMDDLLQYGKVQRALLGVQINDIDANLVNDKRLRLDSYRGVYIENVSEKGAAAEAGIKAGDIIIQINNIDVNSSSALQEIVAVHHPGDEIKITYLRKGKEYTTKATLKNTMGTTALAARVENPMESILGAELQTVNTEEQQSLGIENGVKVTKLYPGKLKDAGIKEGFIITHLDKKAVKSPADVIKSIRNRNGTPLLVEGIYEDGTKDYLAVAP